MGRRVLIVLDTHAWVWWTGDLPGLSRRAAEVIDGADRIGVCSISCFEVAGLARRGRITVEGDVKHWVARALGEDRVEPLSLDPDVAVAAGALDRDFPGDPADRIIYATARAWGVPLVTRDKRLQAYDGAGTVW